VLDYDSLYTNDLIYTADGSEVKVKIAELTRAEKKLLSEVKTPEDVREARQEIINGRTAVKTADSMERELLVGLEKIRKDIGNFYNNLHQLSGILGEINEFRN